jgi:hypothetical protein
MGLEDSSQLQEGGMDGLQGVVMGLLESLAAVLPSRARRKKEARPFAAAAGSFLPREAVTGCCNHCSRC